MGTDNRNRTASFPVWYNAELKNSVKPKKIEQKIFTQNKQHISIVSL